MYKADKWKEEQEGRKYGSITALFFHVSVSIYHLRPTCTGRRYIYSPFVVTTDILFNNNTKFACNLPASSGPSLLTCPANVARGNA